MPAAVSAIATTVAEQDDPQAGAVPADLWHVWAQITDPRGRWGRRHSLVVILALVQAAVAAGATSLAVIRHWISAASPQVLADIGARRNPRTGEYQAPHPDTICRVLERLDAAEVGLCPLPGRATGRSVRHQRRRRRGRRTGGGECGRQVPARHRR
jgi:hypothetical protein